MIWKIIEWNTYCILYIYVYIQILYCTCWWLECHQSWSKNHSKQCNPRLSGIFIISVRSITAMTARRSTWSRKSQQCGTACSCRKPEATTHTLEHIGSSFYCAWGTSIPQGLADLHSIWTKKREGWKGDAIKFRSHNHCKDFLLYILNTGICFFQFSTHRF